MADMEGCRLQALTIRRAAAANELSEMVVDAKVSAPVLTSSRAPLTVVCSVDRSGSMSGEKLKLVKATLRFLVSQLSSEDKFSLVVWDDTVDTVFAPAKMNPEGKEAALEAVKVFESRGRTNLSGGLLQALEEMTSDEDVNEPGRTSSVLLFTDGHANRGVTEAEKLTECMRGAIEATSMVTAPSVFTFGFGVDHDANMLRAISDQGNGLYYFIEGKENIPQTFADCLGGLLSVVGQNMVLTVEALNGATISTLHTQATIKEQTEECLKLQLGDMYSEESRDVLFSMNLPAGEACGSTELCRLSLKYFDNVNACPADTVAEVCVERVESMSEDDQVQDEHVSRELARVMAAAVMVQANDLGRSGRYSEGRALLQKNREGLGSVCGTEELQKDLLECEEGMVDHSTYSSRGAKSMMNYSGAHSKQRSCAIRSSRSTTTFQSPKKAAMVKQAQAFMAHDQEEEEEEPPVVQLQPRRSSKGKGNSTGRVPQRESCRLQQPCRAVQSPQNTCRKKAMPSKKSAALKKQAPAAEMRVGAKVRGAAAEDRMQPAPPC
eukprot:TRINITY_DN10572_c0_g2_i2.p1 TRINITY_DN10572_c0_g2~~TRINITY_DN10572_c0_g2_i2.p1  ORF type:complete len:551 (+),score=157.79 TRINITY_DN10572_c0_g2_i2:117-1769(+)